MKFWCLAFFHVDVDHHGVEADASDHSDASDLANSTPDEIPMPGFLGAAGGGVGEGRAGSDGGETGIA